MENNKEVTDTNVGNIKEDINKLKTYIKEAKEELNMFGYITTLENDLKRTERLIKAYEILQNKVKELENYINPSKARISYFDTKKRANVVIEGFIPKQKIKDKIEELKYRADGIAGTYQYADSQEHLQEKKNKVIELRTKAMALEELLKEVNK